MLKTPFPWKWLTSVTFLQFHRLAYIDVFKSDQRNLGHPVPQTCFVNLQVCCSEADRGRIDVFDLLAGLDPVLHVGHPNILSLKMPDFDGQHC